jgi:hypothetical protein
MILGVIRKEQGYYREPKIPVLFICGKNATNEVL